MNGSNLPHLAVKGIDKYVHFIFHFVFALLWFMYFYKKTIRISKSAFVVFMGSVVFGIAIECCQALFTTTRKADIYDVLANSIGALCALTTLLLSFHFYKKTVEILA